MSLVTRLVMITVLLPVLLLPACSAASETAATVRDCTALAGEIADSGLAGVPSAAQAEQAAAQLEERIQALEPGDVRDAAGTLRDRLREVQQAAADADPAAVTTAAQNARDAARAIAEACGLPVDAFLGG